MWMLGKFSDAQEAKRKKMELGLHFGHRHTESTSCLTKGKGTKEGRSWPDGIVQIR